MPILRPYLSPTDMPLPVVATSRRKRQSMVDPDFYKKNASVNQQEQETQLITPEPEARQEQRFAGTAPNTSGYLQEQLERFRASTAPPALEPSARVRSIPSELVEPSSFKKFYDMLNSIGNIGKQQVAAEQARSAVSRGGFGQPRTSTGTGNAYGSGVPSNPRANFQYAQSIAPQYGWNNRELSAWYTLGMKESGWNHNAQNPTSTAYGIGQFLNSTWKTVGGVKTSDPRSQVEYMAKYIKQRYGSPSAALAFHLRNNWY